MAYDEQLANRIRQAFGVRHDITERKMFGGLAFLCLGRMCCGIVGSDLMVRIPADEVAAIMRSRCVRPMDFTGKPLKGFVYVSAPGFRTRAALRAWLSRGERVAAEIAARTARPCHQPPRQAAPSPDAGTQAVRPATPRRPPRGQCEEEDHADVIDPEAHRMRQPVVAAVEIRLAHATATMVPARSSNELSKMKRASVERVWAISP
jgi:hypothetical protein